MFCLVESLGQDKLFPHSSLVLQQSHRLDFTDHMRILRQNKINNMRFGVLNHLGLESLSKEGRMNKKKDRLWIGIKKITH